MASAFDPWSFGASTDLAVMLPRNRSTCNGLLVLYSSSDFATSDHEPSPRLVSLRASAPGLASEWSLSPSTICASAVRPSRYCGDWSIVKVATPTSSCGGLVTLSLGSYRSSVVPAGVLTFTDRLPRIVQSTWMSLPVL